MSSIQNQKSRRLHFLLELDLVREVKKPFQESNEMSFSRHKAEIIGMQAIAWLASNDELFPIFAGASGAGIDDVKERLQDPEFQGSVLDFLLMDDAWVTAFCDTEGLPYDTLMQARAALPGGEQVHWT
jgi:hypothetical protein